MSKIIYCKLEPEEKEHIFLPRIIEILKSFCDSKQELSTLPVIKDIEKKVQKMDEFTKDTKSDFQTITKIEKKTKVNPQKEPLTFINLSPNVIVYNILPFHVIRSKEIKNEFDLYGYFKLDRLRNIWFVFLSLNIVHYDFGDFNDVIYMSFYYKIEKLKYFCCLRSFFSKNNELQFKNLKTLSVEESWGEEKIPLNSILKKNNFQSLKSISSVGLKGINVINLNPGIEILNICYGKWQLLDTCNLKSLFIHRAKINGFEKWGNLPNVEKLSIIPKGEENFSNFFKFHKFEKLKLFILCGDILDNEIDSSCLKDVKVNWKHLKKITLRYDNITDIFFQRNVFINLKTIEMKHLKFITGNNWKISGFLKTFSIKKCRDFEPSFFKRQEMNNVEKIICDGCNKIDKSVFIELSKKLKEQKLEKELNEIKNSINDNLKEYVFFQNNLEKRYNRLLNLKHLAFRKAQYINNRRLPLSEGYDNYYLSE